MAEVPRLTGIEELELKGRLGSGGYGDVWEAFDRTRGVTVALKTMKTRDAAALLDFKNEFRTLTELSHPNLVRLYELHVTRELTFFTMERVRGRTVVDYISSTVDSAAPTPTQVSPLIAEVPPDLTTSETVKRSGDPSPSLLAGALWPKTPDAAEEDTAPTRPSGYRYDELRVRAVLAQLVSAIGYLHDRGRLHRDLKPSNVLVADDGRLVVLDFGLVTDVKDATLASHELVGTPFYMAPENVEGHASTASDWYAVGVILFQMLTGTLPFTGQPFQVLIKKQKLDAPPPRALDPAIPEDLSTLCAQLLHRDARQRPTRQQLAAALSTLSAGAAAPRPKAAAPFIGRHAQLERLRDAFAVTRRGTPAVVLQRGLSAMGKSTLAQHFVAELKATVPGVLVLSGRCHPQESVTYKAFDPLIDAATRFMAKLSRDELTALLPADAVYLAQIFPVLKRLAPLASAKGETLEPIEHRRRAFAALRQLFRTLAQARPVVLLIDDVQWGEHESAALLFELVRPIDAPALMLLVVYRSDEEVSSACLSELVPQLRSVQGAALHLQEIDVGPLSQAEATELAAAVLGGEGAARAQRIAKEADGQPLFVSELAHEAAQRPDTSTVAEPELSLDSLIRARARKLPGAAARLLELVCIADRPIERRLVESVAGADEVMPHWQQLTAARWVRTRTLADVDVVEPYHDRVREAVAGALSSRQRSELHGRLARGMETHSGNVEALAAHFHAAGDSPKTAHYAAQAAAAAEHVLAFDRAARLYQLAIDALDAKDPQRRVLERSLGSALALAGRRTEAATAFLSAVDGASPDEAMDLRRGAAQQLIITGQIEKGVEIIRRVLAAVGISYPEKLGQVIVLLLWFTLRLWLREAFAPPPRRPPTPREALTLDGLHVTTHFLGLVDPLRGMCFSKRHALQALEVDDAARTSRALASEIPYSATRGGEVPSKHETAVHAKARALALASKSDEALGFVEITAAIAAMLRGRWDATLEHLGAAEGLYKKRHGSLWEMNVIHFFTLYVLRYRGEWRAASEYLSNPLTDARARGDVYAETQLVTVAGDLAALMAGDAERARLTVQESLNRWGRPGFDLQRVQGLFVDANAVLYTQPEGPRALELLDQVAPGIKKSGALFVPSYAIAWHEVHARAALAQASATKDRRRWLKLAESDAMALKRQKMRWSSALATLVEAAVLEGRGETAQAARTAEVAAQQFDAVQMKLHAAAARWRACGSAAALKPLELEGIKDPTRLAAALAPWPGG